MDDLINRQSALDALDKRFESFIKRFGYDSYERADEKTKLVCDGLSEAEDVIMGLPSAQPDIIRCKDCKYWHSGSCEYPEHVVNCQDYYVGDIETEAEHFCGYAERREVTE